MTTTVGIVYHDRFMDHRTGGHPECPERAEVIRDTLREGFGEDLVWLSPRPARIEDLQRVHAPGYIEFIRSLSESGGAYVDQDTPCCPESYDVARLAAGAGLVAADAVMNGQVLRAFAAVRPPGHHAFRDRGGGFCLFNNLAICLEYARARWGIRKVAVVDWDVHHGNGTEDIFSDDPEVLYVSLHQWPHYPGTGGPHHEPGGRGRRRNFPLPRGTDGLVYRALVSQDIQGLVEAFEPDLILGSAGFDAGRDDPLAGMLLDAEDFEALSASLSCMADRLCQGRLITFLEGGYSLRSLGEYAAGHVRGLLVRGDSGVFPQEQPE